MEEEMIVLEFSGIRVGDRRFYKGNEYIVTRFTQMKIPGAGWTLAVVYVPVKDNGDKEIQNYTREILDFKSKFKKEG